jgi:hypothetical protein
VPFKIDKGAPDIPPGNYKAQLAGTQIKSGGKFKSPDNPDGEYRIWDWLVEKDGELVPFSDTTSIGTTPKTVTFARLTALLGRTPEVGEEIEDPTGKTIVLQIGKKENGWPKVDSVGPYVDPQQTLPGVPR